MQVAQKAGLKGVLWPERFTASALEGYGVLNFLC